VSSHINKLYYKSHLIDTDPQQCQQTEKLSWDWNYKAAAELQWSIAHKFWRQLHSDICVFTSRYRLATKSGMVRTPILHLIKTTHPLSFKVQLHQRSRMLLQWCCKRESRVQSYMCHIVTISAKSPWLCFPYQSTRFCQMNNCSPPSYP